MLVKEELSSNSEHDWIWPAGELAIQCSPEQLQPFAAPIVERLMPILAAPMTQMPRSIVENRFASYRLLCLVPCQAVAAALCCDASGPVSMPW